MDLCVQVVGAAQQGVPLLGDLLEPDHKTPAEVPLTAHALEDTPGKPMLPHLLSALLYCFCGLIFNHFTFPTQFVT